MVIGKIETLKFIIGNILVTIPDIFMLTLSLILNESGNDTKSIVRYGQ